MDEGALSRAGIGGLKQKKGGPKTALVRELHSIKNAPMT
jgi:hypothetical protein